MPGAAGTKRFARRRAHSSTLQPSALKKIEALRKRTEVDVDANKLTEKYKQELHEKRLKELDKRLREAQKDNWRYPPAGSLFGFSSRR